MVVEFEEVRYGMLLMVLCDRVGCIFDVWISFGCMHEVRAFRERKKRSVWFRELVENCKTGRCDCMTESTKQKVEFIQVKLVDNKPAIEIKAKYFAKRYISLPYKSKAFWIQGPYYGGRLDP